MIRKPICEKPLDKKTITDVGFGTVDLSIEYPEGKAFKRTYGPYLHDDFVTQVRDLEAVYRHEFKRATSITLFFNAPLWDKLYEFNKEDRQWYLVEQGQGFA